MPKHIEGIPLKCPVSLHFLITSRCNLSCKRCFYKGHDSEIPEASLMSLISDFSSIGGKSLAIGGGEPMLYPGIEDVVKFAKGKGLFVGITSNGTILKPVMADRVHISYDEIHETSEPVVRKAVEYYRGRGLSVGINHILTDLSRFKDVLSLFECTINVLLEKPESRFRKWQEFWEIAGRERKRLWLDPCLLKRNGKDLCRQGYTSMSIDSNFMAGICSNTTKKIRFSSVQDTWNLLERNDACIF